MTNIILFLSYQVVHRGLFVPIGARFAVSTQPQQSTEAATNTNSSDVMVTEAVAQDSSGADQAINAMEEEGGTGGSEIGAMDVDHVMRGEGGAGDDDDEGDALIEGQMYDSDPIVHALRRRARELKGMLGV